MQILILYATNSGSTYTAAKIIQEVLEEHQHQVTLQDARQSQLRNSLDYEFVLWGSPSWKWGEDEGAPHEAFIELMQQEGDLDFGGKRFAVFGCGDSDYTYFCGAVDKLQAFITEHNGQLIGEPLRLDGFFFNLDVSTAQTRDWAETVAGRIGE